MRVGNGFDFVPYAERSEQPANGAVVCKGNGMNRRIEHESAAGELLAATADAGLFLEHGNAHAAFGKNGAAGEPAYARTDDDCIEVR